MKVRVLRDRERKDRYRVLIGPKEVGEIIAEPPHGAFSFYGKHIAAYDFDTLADAECAVNELVEDGRIG
jgi:hypothetical protein